MRKLPADETKEVISSGLSTAVTAVLIAVAFAGVNWRKIAIANVGTDKSTSDKDGASWKGRGGEREGGAPV